MNRLAQELEQFFYASSDLTEQPTKVSPRKKGKNQQRFSPEYLEFIKSPEWKKKRSQRIRLDTVNGKVICQFCGRPIKYSELEVDHVTYPPKGSPIQAFIDQPLSELRSLHKDCHAFKTKQSRRKDR